MKKKLSKTIGYWLLVIGYWLIILFFPQPVRAQSFGFNIHSLTKESDEYIECLLDWLSNNCQTTIVRLWGYRYTLGINGMENIQKVLDAAPSNVKFIIALEDFPFGPPSGNPQVWFSSTYKEQYRDYVQAVVNRYKNNDQILVWEIMNEPHCKGDANCLPALKSFIQDMAQVIKSIDPSTYISPGLMGGHIPWSEYESISNLPEITANCCHYNTDTNDASTCLEAINHKGNVDFFYVGEVGYRGSADCSGGGCTNSNCTNCCEQTVLQQRAEQINNDKKSLSGANAFLVWQFSPPGNSNLICDSFSIFPGDPLCSSTERFTCSPIPEEEIDEPIIINYSGQVCSDFVEERGDLHSGEIPERVNLNPLIGHIKMLSAKFPDFGRAAESFSTALNRTLPLYHAKDLSLPGSTKMYFKHFAVPEDEEGGFDYSEMTECEETPQSTVSVPAGLWGRLAGAVRGLSTYLGWGAPVNKYQFELAPTDYSCLIGSCAPGQKAKEVKLNAENSRTRFGLNAWADKTTQIETDPETGELEIETKKQKRVKFMSRAQLSGAGETAINVDFLHRYLTPETIELVRPRDEARAITEGFRYDVQFSPVEEGEHPGQYYDLRKIRNFYCMFYCASHPNEEPPLDPLCPSCDPNHEDYRDPPREDIPKPSKVPPHCHWVGAYGCQYYTCKIGEDEGCERSCANDPLCEGGYCNSFQSLLAKDVYAPGGQYCPEKICKLGGTCHWMQFNKPSSYYYPEEDLPKFGPPWGPCFYANPNVCVKDGWSPWDGCIVGCNPACCQGARSENYD